MNLLFYKFPKPLVNQFLFVLDLQQEFLLVIQVKSVFDIVVERYSQILIDNYNF